MTARYLGNFWCDLCPGETPRQQVWTQDGADGHPVVIPRVCRRHYAELFGDPPPAFKTADILGPEPTPAPRLYHPIRRVNVRLHREASGGVRIEHVRHVDDLGTVADHTIELTAAEWIEAVLAMSAHADDGDADKTLARVELERIHRGRTTP